VAQCAHQQPMGGPRAGTPDAGERLDRCLRALAAKALKVEISRYYVGGDSLMYSAFRALRLQAQAGPTPAATRAWGPGKA